MKVNLTYFKASGKYYSSGEYVTQAAVSPEIGCPALHEIVGEVAALKAKRHLPGLIEGHSDFTVLIGVPDHPHDHPHLLLADEVEARRMDEEWSEMPRGAKESAKVMPSEESLRFVSITDDRGVPSDCVVVSGDPEEGIFLLTAEIWPVGLNFQSWYRSSPTLRWTRDPERLICIDSAEVRSLVRLVPLMAKAMAERLTEIES